MYVGCAVVVVVVLRNVTVLFLADVGVVLRHCSAHVRDRIFALGFFMKSFDQLK